MDISDFKVPGGFKPGAILVQNNGYPKVPFRLIAVVLTSEAFEAVEVPCFSYIEAARPDSKPIRRCFFCGPSTLPSDTPRGLQNLRNDELKAIRGELGNGGKERKIPDRVYEWDVYNDLNQLKLERWIPLMCHLSDYSLLYTFKHVCEFYLHLLMCTWTLS